QAEDGIRDGHVTGVQTCALPIWHLRQAGAGGVSLGVTWFLGLSRGVAHGSSLIGHLASCAGVSRRAAPSAWLGGSERTSSRAQRSEERRVGKECRAQWRRDARSE